MPPIRIRSITAYHCKENQPFRGTYTGGGKDPDMHVLFVAISDGEATGYGECIPTSLMRPKGSLGTSNIEEWPELLSLCRGLIGQDARRLVGLIPDDFRRGDDTNSITDAVDFALHDLVGRKLGVPVSTLLGGQGRTFVWGMPVVHTGVPEAMACRAEEWHRKYGFIYFKLKPVGTLEADLETLRKVRERTSPRVRFLMDANYHLKMTPDEFVAYANALAEYGLAAYEDPIDTDFATYRSIRERIRPELTLDEKARTAEAVLEIAEARCAGAINIHANWAGGFQAALRKAAIASAAGIRLMIGSTHYYGPGAAAYQTLASLISGAAPCEQVYMEVYGMKSLIADPYEIRDGKILIRDAPGLGVTPDMDAIAGRAVDTERFQ